VAMAASPALGEENPLFFQATVATQAHPSFQAAYSGLNSLHPGQNPRCPWSWIWARESIPGAERSSWCSPWSYAQATARHVDVSETRADGRTKAGVAASANYDFGGGRGAFARASFNDGQNETWAFTEIDRSLAVGAVHAGGPWRREHDEAGAAVVVSALSAAHRAYLRGLRISHRRRRASLRDGSPGRGLPSGGPQRAGLPRRQLPAALQSGVQPRPRSSAHLYGPGARGVLMPVALNEAPREGDRS